MSEKVNDALCCTRGTLRSCRRPRNYRPENRWLRGPVDRDWHREVGDLKCEQCGRITTHAIITGNNHAESIRDAATGWHFTAIDAADHARIREQWRQGMPRNPYLRHMWFTSDEEKAREAGLSHFPAVCKAMIPTPALRPSDRDSTVIAHDQLVEPDEFHDVDREDPETGLWWFDGDCTDCLCRSNAMAIDSQHEKLKSKMQELVDKIANLDAATVAHLLGQFNDAESAH